MTPTREQDIAALVGRLEEPRQGIHENGEEEMKTWEQLWEQCKEAAQALRALEAELAKVRKDAERIDWMEQREDGFANIDRITSVGGKFNGLPTLREAIDSAIESAGKGMDND